MSDQGESRQTDGSVPPRASVAPPTHLRRTVDGERLVAVFSQLVEPIGRTLPSSSEVVLHDLSLLPNSIVAVYGNVTGRRLGDPATDLLLESAVSGFADHYVGYESQLPDGRRLRSSTMIIRDVAGNPVAALCINSDLSSWLTVHRIISTMIGDPLTSNDAEITLEAPETLSVSEPPRESFVRDVDELAALLIGQAIADAPVPVARMKKEHKLQIVRDLKSRGIFLLRDAVEMIAESLDVSRFTIYNYLNEIAAIEGTQTLSDAPSTTPRRRKATTSDE